MQAEIFYEVLRFCARDDLDTLQLVCRSLLKMIVASSGVLPRRTLYVIDMGHFAEERLLRVAPSEDIYERPPDFSASLIDGDFDGMLLRFQHAFVEDFYFDDSDSAFLQHFRAGAQHVEFLVNRIWFDMLAAEVTDDYAVVDSIVNLLRPRAYKPDLHLHDEERCIAVLKLGSFLSHVKTLNFDDEFRELPAPAFMLSETCYPNYDLQSYDSAGVDWLDTFFDTLIRGECTNDKLESVGVSWADDHDEEQKWRLPKLLSEPSIKDVRIPRDDFAAYRTIMTRPDYRVGKCDQYVLTSAKLKKRMDVFKWTAKVPEGRSTVHAVLCEVKDI